jgi:hypothetical protein
MDEVDTGAGQYDIEKLKLLALLGPKTLPVIPVHSLTTEICSAGWVQNIDTKSVSIFYFYGFVAQCWNLAAFQFPGTVFNL